MKFKTFLTIQAIVLLIFGFGSMFMPKTVWGMFGLMMEGESLYIMRFAASLTIGNVIVTWLFRDVTDKPAIKALGYDSLVTWVILIIVDIIYQLNGTLSALGWTNVLLCGLFTYGWIHFLFIKPVE